MEPGAIPDRGEAAAHLRLYIARSTPNSIRAEQNLTLALDGLGDELLAPALEIVDVFTKPKRAIVDGVVVTPTLLGFAAGKRFVLMGDLADQALLRRTLQDLLEPRRAT